MIAPSVHVSADDFFVKLKGRAKRIADDQAFVMSDSMKFVLQHRGKFKGGSGQYPSWRANQNVKTAGDSFKHWKVVKRDSGEYWLTNTKTDTSTGYNYPRNLMFGNGWNLRTINAAFTGIKADGTPSRLKAVGGKIFSTQMPNGLNPWLVIKREDLKNNIRKEFKRLGVKR